MNKRFEDTFARTYHVRLLFKEEPIFNIPNFIEALGNRCGNMDTVSDELKNLIFAFRDYEVQYKDAVVPAQIMCITTDDIEEGVYEALSQSHSWREAGLIVEDCKYMMLVTDFLSSGLNYKDRIDLYSRYLYTLVEHSNCDAIYFYHSQNVINPRDFLSNEIGSDNYDELFGFMNVRLFNIQGTEDEIVMDTLGLGAIGLPDIQCHFKLLDVNSVANLLYTYGNYLYVNGDVINDNETIQGVREDDKWVCQHESSLAGPERTVLDINPGSQFSGVR